VDEKSYLLKAGESACPWCGAVTKHDLVFPVPMILKCECGGMWVMTTAPPNKLPSKG
jgi:hypothetical protein